MKTNYPRLQKKHPILDVFQRIEIRAPLREFAVLEPYVGNAQANTVHYAAMPTVAALEGWDINRVEAEKAKAIMPGAQIKHADANREIAQLASHYDVIVLDNNMIQVPFEHFSLFPHVFKGLKDHSFLVISVCPNPATYLEGRRALLQRTFNLNPEVYLHDWSRARSEFYGVELTGKNGNTGELSANDMLPIYMEKALKAGFFTKYQTTITRSIWLKYLLLELERTSDRHAKEEKARDAWARKDAGL